MGTPQPVSKDVRAGAAIYRKPVLAVYDTAVVRLSNTYAWRCDRGRQLALYRDNIGARHLDVGPGTGWYLERVATPGTRVTLLDLSPGSLDVAATRLRRVGVPVDTVVANVLEPLPEGVSGHDSVGVNYVMHCVPGPWKSKGAAFAHLAAALHDRGVLFGSTILGAGVRRNPLAAALSRTYNATGVFHNEHDDEEGLRSALHAAFTDIAVIVVGNVALFTARRPRR